MKLITVVLAALACLVASAHAQFLLLGGGGGRGRGFRPGRARRVFRRRLVGALVNA